VLITDAVSIGFVRLVFFHLCTYALFKALLFICAGVISHKMKDSQDVRFMDNLSFKVTSTCACLMFLTLSCVVCL
jgi:NADH-ubiquinone oxidoreductase chain 5